MNEPIAIAADAGSRTTYEFARLQELGESRWQMFALVAVVALVVAYVVWLYRRDSQELRPWLRATLLLLRLGALAALLFFFLDLEKRTERDVVHPSRVLLLVDTSQSMGLYDGDASAVPAAPSRIDQVIRELQEGTLLEELRAVHEVLVARFDRDSSRVLSLGRLGAPTEFDEQGPEGTGSEGKEPDNVEPGAAGEDDKSDGGDRAIDWQEALVPRGAETRLGRGLKWLLDQERATPVSAVVVLSDGGQNSGVEPDAAIELARRSKIPVYTVGLGSREPQLNVRIGDVVAPSRAYPGDAFAINAFLQAQGLAGRTVTVELFSRDSSQQVGEGALEESRRVRLGPDGEAVPVRFELKSDETGRRTYRVVVDAPRGDRHAADNVQEVDVELVDRETRVLLVASGATREYRFLRNQLHRDKDVVLDIWLQSARPGISQDADTLLDDFPATKEELYAYDAIVAFDPDWTQLDGGQVELMEKWVAEEAGGLIAIAGPIHTDDWSRRRELSKLLGLYPVIFQRRLSLLADAEYGSKIPWPVEFTPEGEQAEFLRLADTAAASQVAWTSFEGVYGYYRVKSAKPGATVYARFSDPQGSVGGDLPIYMTGHLYGAGRVFYLGSGEMWRLRALDEAYLETFYTKLIRYVSQGRLLRGSTQGVLLVERDRYLLGETVVVRAQLHDAQHEPLEVPSALLQITRPDSTTQTLKLEPDATRKGMYSGQFTALQEGVHRFDLPVPETIDEQLSRRIQVKVPDLERENPQRNDPLLSEIAEKTEGRYYVGLAAAMGAGGVPPLVSQLRDRTETTVLQGAPDNDFNRRLMQWLLWGICGALCLEWLLRRLFRLA